MSAAVVPVGGNWRPSADRTSAPAALKPAEARAVVAALEHADQGTAAKAAGLTLRTYQRYLAMSPVRTAIAAGAMERLRRVTTAIARHAEKAADVLGEMARGETPATSARVRACTAVLEAAQRARAVEDHEVRLAEIEAQIAKQLPTKG